MPKPPKLFIKLYIIRQGKERGKMQKEEFNQIKYQNEFKKKNYDRFELVMPKGQKEVIRKQAKAAGQSISEYINTAITEKMEKEETTCG